MNAKYPPIGTVSHGTMRDEDLIPEFAYILEKYAPERYESLRAEYASLFEEMDAEDFEDFEDHESASYLTGALFEEMEEIAPPYCYFGSSEGDGSDYGFWPSIDSLEEDARYGEDVVKVDDLSEVPDDWRGYVMAVSDHGNVTLYTVSIPLVPLAGGSALGTAESFPIASKYLEEIWSVV